MAQLFTARADAVSRAVLRDGGLALAAALVAISGCRGPQSTLDPSGRAADEIATLFWWMTIGGAIIWIAIVGLSLYAISARRKRTSNKAGGVLIIGGGVVFPSVVLVVLLAYSLAMLPRTLARAPAGTLQIEVSGEQWWWRVQYRPPGGEPVDVANEIRLPVDALVEFELVSPDVIHSFWIPSLGGKMDMIPGRTTWLTLHPQRTGRFRGVCAEFCGASHAWMAFPVVVHERAEFERWLAHQADSAATPGDELTARGQHVFLANGCGACHTVRGTPATGVIGPDLTHVGGRLTLAAGRLGNAPRDFASWLRHPEQLKPSAHMPSFAMLPRADVHALTVYLESLQ